VDDLLAPLGPVDDATTRRLHARLVAAAERAGILDVAYQTVDSPLGALLLAATEKGLVRVAFARQSHEAVLIDLAQRVSPRVLNAPGRLDPFARELGEYFEGSRDTFDLPLDLRLAHGFRREVLTHLADIRYGATASYAAVAAAAGDGAGYRATAHRA